MQAEPVLAGRVTVLAAALGAIAASCSSPSPTPQASWQVVLADQPPTLLSLWGTSPKDVYAVGGPLGNGGPSAMLHFDGASWRYLQPGGTETFWWVNGTSDHDVWAVGEQGRITHWDGAKFAELTPRPTTATLYGVWAASATDVWAVGGTPNGGATQPNDVLLHFDGTAWAPDTGIQKLGRTLFKVWGTSSTNVYVVGEGETIWHRRGTQWSQEGPPSPAGRLLTVHGCGPGEVYAVGDLDVLRSDGTTWTRLGLTLMNEVNGVSCASPGNVVVVGSGGLKERLVHGQWVDDFSQDPHRDLHSAWSDPAGGFWSAGGDFSSPPNDAGLSRQGLVAYYGRAPP
jgi:hypothetical protein